MKQGYIHGKGYGGETADFYLTTKSDEYWSSSEGICGEFRIEEFYEGIEYTRIIRQRKRPYIQVRFCSGKWILVTVPATHIEMQFRLSPFLGEYNKQTIIIGIGGEVPEESAFKIFAWCCRVGVLDPQISQWEGHKGHESQIKGSIKFFYQFYINEYIPWAPADDITSFFS